MQYFEYIFKTVKDVADLMGAWPAASFDNLNDTVNEAQDDNSRSFQVGFPLPLCEILANGANSETGETVVDGADFPVKVRIVGVPSQVRPLIRFALINDVWQIQRETEDGPRRPRRLGTIRPFNLQCPVCNQVDLRTETNPGIHGVLATWGSIHIKVCKRCVLRVRDTSQFELGACFCCFNVTDEVRPYQRDDNGLVLMLCQQCATSTWATVMAEANITLVACPRVSRAHVELAEQLTILHPEQLIAAFNSRKRPAAATAALVPETKRVGCAACADQPVTRCTVTDCSQSRCAGCLRHEVGSLSLVYHSPARLWKCPTHRN